MRTMSQAVLPPVFLVALVAPSLRAQDADDDGRDDEEKIAKIIKELKARGWTKMNHLLVFSSGDAPELYATGGADGAMSRQVSGFQWDNHAILVS